MRWLQNFMYGRYGLDELGKVNIFLWLILAFINIFVRSKIIYIIYFVLCLLCLFRMMSKNTVARSAENRKFIKLFGKVKGDVETKKSHASDKTHKYIRCKICGANLRVSRKKGKHTVKCPKCGKEFGVRIWF